MTMVLFTSLVFLRQCRVRLRLGDIPGLYGCRFSDSIEKGPTADAAAHCLVRSRFSATEPQWPRTNSTVSRSLRTRHSRVVLKIRLRALRLLRFRPSSLPCFAASDDGYFAPGEPLARPTGLSCDSHNRCLQPSLPLLMGCRFRAASSDIHCKSLIRIGRTTLLVPSVRRNVVESWQVQNYSSGIMTVVADA